MGVVVYCTADDSIQARSAWVTLEACNPVLHGERIEVRQTERSSADWSSGLTDRVPAWFRPRAHCAALQEILGHQSIETTQRHARLGDDMVMREAERLARP